MDQLKSRLTSLFELPGANRNLSMEGLRAIAVILVFFVHFHSCFLTWVMPGQPGADFAYALRWVGYIGVDLFFVLSGYLIYAAVLSPKFTYRKFMSRRVHRIYPTFAVLLLLYIALSFVVKTESKLPAEPLSAVVYILENALLLPGLFDLTPIITVSWSLSYEFFFYLVLPVVVAALQLRKRSRAFRSVVFALMAVAVAAFPALGLGHVQFLLFLSGMLVYEARERMQALQETKAGASIRAAGLLTAIGVLPVAYVLFNWVSAKIGEPFGFTARTVWLFFGLGVLVSVTLTERGAFARFCRWTPFRWLGNMSYSYYLLHGLVLKAVSTVLLKVTGHEAAHPFAFWIVMPLAFSATLAGSAVLFAYVEKPLSLAAGAFRFPWQALATQPAVASKPDSAQ